jgi:hypothetical protein
VTSPTRAAYPSPDPLATETEPNRPQGNPTDEPDPQGSPEGDPKVYGDQYNSPDQTEPERPNQTDPLPTQPAGDPLATVSPQPDRPAGSPTDLKETRREN